jgi:hypothetical protein
VVPLPVAPKDTLAEALWRELTPLVEAAAAAEGLGLTRP